MNLWREEIIPRNQFSRPGVPLLVRNIVIHYTANPGASAANHVRYFGETLPNSQTTYASAHLFVDKSDAVLIIPLEEMAYHASQANPYSIGIEMCIEKDWTFHPETVRQTVQITAELCKRYGLSPLRDVIRHYDVTGKICPKPYVDDPAAWENFKQSASDTINGKEEGMMIEDLQKRIVELEQKEAERNAMNCPDWAKEALNYYKDFIDTPTGSYDFWRMLTIQWRKEVRKHV